MKLLITVKQGKQGCVLSPLLFALYLADLEYSMTFNGQPIGAQLGSFIVPFLAYADDMVFLANTQRVFQIILSILAHYCNKWQLTISTSKSFVMTFHGPMHLGHLWTLGIKHVSPNVTLPMQIIEVRSVRYLGVQVSRGPYIFSKHVVSLVQKLRSASWLTLTCANRLYRQAAYGAQIWKVYSLPTVFNASEVFVFSQTTLQKFEKSQNMFMHQLLNTGNCTPIIAMQYELAISPLATFLRRKQIHYYQYIANLPHTRIINEAFRHHVMWANNNNITHTWHRQNTIFHNSLQIPMNIVYTNKQISPLIAIHQLQDRDKLRNTSCLFMCDKLYLMVDWRLNTTQDYIFWIRFRIAGIWLQGRTLQLFCGNCRCPTMESPYHFLFVCSARPGPSLERLRRHMRIQDEQEHDQLRTLFSETTPMDVRRYLGTVIRLRLNI